MIASENLAITGTSSLFLIIVGVLVAALLIGSFWYGSRRLARRADPGVRPAEQPPRARAREESWQSPEDDPDRRRPGS
ncbi:DUF6479 family protein [Streptomyces sp. 12297]|uniref:DUF6479 family protein n=1 Tax=Streptomyces sp. NBC_00239 TaxID=2903640 RepID=UPI002E2B2C98|nr:DUF6479 family protein [Streptomyces sp. NBC_00239]